MGRLIGRDSSLSSPSLSLSQFANLPSSPPDSVRFKLQPRGKWIAECKLEGGEGDKHMSEVRNIGN